MDTDTAGSLFSLNERQIQGVTTTEGRIRIVAGAGSGKTRVLAHRFAYLVNDIGISPGNILCMTFTNKAAQEMKQRISRLTDRGNVNDFICTIHGFCVKFLRREIYRLGYPKSFIVIDEEDARQLAKEAMEEFGMDRRKTTAERFLKQVSGFKGLDPDAYIHRLLLPSGDKSAPDAVARYIQLQLKQYALDFDDLLFFTIYILDHFPEANAYWTDKLNYILVDEVQDCSSDDWKLMRRLARGHGNLFIVGDPDQAIYEWRGAKPKIFVDFDAQATVILNQNYRSTPQILDIANSIIANNHNRIPKELFTEGADGPKGVHYHARSEKEEAQWIASTIAEEARKGAPYSDFAVLYRASFVSRTVEQELLRMKIPYTVWGGVRFYERREIKDVLSYLRLLVNPDDDISFARIVNVPARKFGKASLGRLRQLAEQEGCSLCAALEAHISEPPFNKAPVRAFLAALEKYRLLLPALSVSELTDELLKETGLMDFYRTDTEEERLENIAELIRSMKDFEASRDAEEDRLAAAYLQEVSLYTNMDFRKDGSTVRLMTIHQSKGLEFPTVFVAGLSEGNFPSHRTIRERRKDGEEEERRLMYVAVTRAMKRLYMTESEGHLNESSGFKYPSRYLAEIPPHLVERLGEWDESLFDGTRLAMKMLDNELAGDSAPKLPVGTRVRHKIFGEGEVTAYSRDNDSYTVRFGDITRNLLPRVLEVV